MDKIKELQKEIKWLKIELYVVVSAFIFLAITLLAVNYGYDFSRGVYKEINISECENLTYSETAVCLVDYVRPFYKYKKTDDNVTLSLDELKYRGGDCFDWSKLYASLSESLGFYGDIFEIQADKKHFHVIATLSNKDGFCIFNLDDNPLCYYFG